MALYLRLARPYFVLLALVTIGRWILSFRVPFEVGTDKLSLVMLTLFSSVFYGAFCRRWRGFTLLQAVSMGATLAFFSQIVILLSTAASYLLGVESYFNNPRALQVTAAIPLGEAMVRRLGGLVTNMIVNGIVGMLGWALGALLPSDRA